MALLALIAMRDGDAVQRVTLQDKLWGDRPPKHGRDSLRKALAALRAVFGPKGEEIVQTVPGGAVRIDRARLWVDVFDVAPARSAAPFMEGFDVAAEGFNDWLRETRAALETNETIAASQPSVRAGALDQVIKLPDLALLPVGGCRPSAITIGNMLASRLARAIRESGVYQVRDHRGLTKDTTPQPGAALAVKIEVLEFGGNANVAVDLVRSSDGLSVWNTVKILELSELHCGPASAACAEWVDQISEAAYRARGAFAGERDEAARLVMGASASLFSLSSEGLAGATVDFERASALVPSAPFSAWACFTAAFRHEQTKGANAIEERERFEWDAARALEFEPFNPLSRALLAHVAGFVLGDFGRAYELIEPVYDRNADQALVHRMRG